MTSTDATSSPARWVGLAIGPVLFVLGLGTTALGLSPEAARVAATMLWMASWWVLEPVPLAATSLLPIVLLPALGVRTTAQATAPYANEVIYLVLGGFMLATALERWHGHSRIAYRLIQLIGTGPHRVVLAVMLATAFISMWISNTATTAMMFPITMAIAALFDSDDGGRQARIALLLATAYSATIGGLGTLVGTPTNLIATAAIKELTGVTVDFGRYLLLGLPVVIVLIPLTWAILVFGVFRGMGSLHGSVRALVTERHRALGPLRGGEAMVLGVFALTALAWVFREPKDLGSVTIPGLTTLLPGLTDAGISITAAVLLFTLRGSTPSGERRPLLRWSEARQIPWEALLFFGSGLSIAAAMESSGLSGWVGERLVALRGLPLAAVFLGLATVIVILGEFASNLAVATMVMPLAAALGAGIGQPPVLVMLLAGFAASLGFALPVATPPNAIVFGSGEIPVRQMMRAGLLIDAVSILVVVGLLSVLAPRVFGGS